MGRNRQSFTFWRSFADVLYNLQNDEQRWQLMKAVMEYSLDKTEPEVEGVVKIAWIALRPICEKGWARAEAGSEGGSKNKQNGSKTEANAKQNSSKTEANAKQNGSKTEANAKQNSSKTEANAKPIYNIQYTDNNKQDTSVCNTARTPDAVIFESLFNDEIWQERVAMARKATIESVLHYLREFQAECEAKGATHNSRADIQSHFVDWMRIQQEKAEKEKADKLAANGGHRGYLSDDEIIASIEEYQKNNVTTDDGYYDDDHVF